MKQPPMTSNSPSMAKMENAGFPAKKKKTAKKKSSKKSSKKSC